jgi:hypothetical protein
MADQPKRWGKVEQPAGREIRLKRRHWAIGDLDTRQGIAIVFGDDDAHASMVEAAPEMLDMLRRYASECAECCGSGLVERREVVDWVQEIYMVDCSDCADIRTLIAKAAGA